MSILFLITAFVFLFIGFKNRNSANDKARTWTRARGRVMEIRTYRNWGGKNIHTPLVLFQTPQGHQFYFNGTGAQISFYRIGQDVEVVYNPHNPSEAAIKSDSGNTFHRVIWFMVAGLALMAALMAFIGELSLLVHLLR
jgi:hypothetical protein